MSAVEEIQAAIEKLTDIQYQVNPGPLVRWTDQENIPGWDGFYVIGDSADEGEDCNPVARVYTDEDMEMLLTLHRTIDAQLAILRTALIETGLVMSKVEKPYWRASLALARAINGAT